MTIKDFKKIIKDLSSLYKKSKNIGEKIEINRAIIHCERQIERMEENERP